MQPTSRHAFTLIEMLVVIALLALLIALLVPCLHSARDVAKSVRCTSNLHQCIAAVVMYGQDFNGVVPQGSCWVGPPGAFIGWACFVDRGTYFGSNRINAGPYLTSRNAECCPNNSGGSYGMVEIDMSGSGQAPSDFGTSSGLQQPFLYFTGIRVPLLPSPSGFVLLIDSAEQDLGQGGVLQSARPGGSGAFKSNMAWTSGQIWAAWLAHPAHANAACADGHVESDSVSRLAATTNYDGGNHGITAYWDNQGVLR